MLNKLRSNQGFTLIELLIVVAIIGILAAIAIPQFAQYRIKGYNTSATSDLRNCRSSQETLFADWQRYGRTEAALLPGAGTTGNNGGAAIVGPGTAAAPCILTLQDAATTPRGIPIALGNQVDMMVWNDATWGSYTIIVKHFRGNQVYAADSDSTAIYKHAAVAPANPNTPDYLIVAADSIAPVSGSDQFEAVPANWLKM